MEKLTFDDLPEAINQLRKDVDVIMTLVQQMANKEDVGASDKPLNVKEAAEFLNLSVQTVYSKVSKQELPFSKSQGSKRLYFFRKDLLDYLKDNRKKSNSEIKAEVDNYLIPKRR